jgi:site-specific DNA-cytosine methylase
VPLPEHPCGPTAAAPGAAQGFDVKQPPPNTTPKFAEAYGFEPATCSSIEDLFAWPVHFLDVMETKFGKSFVARLGQGLDGFTYSTAFSGIDSPGCSLEMLVNEIATRTGTKRATTSHLCAVERDQECVAELLCHPTPPACIFSDQCDFWSESVSKQFDKMEAGGALSFDNALPFVLKCPEVFVSPTAYCCVHRRQCRYAEARLHIAGVPCVDWSPMGLRTGQHGKTVRCFTSWCAQRRRIQEDVVGIECSCNFDTAVAEKAFSDMYVVNACKIDSAELGWPGRRRRFWAAMVHKRLVGQLVSSFANVVPMFYRTLETTWKSFLTSTTEERLDELAWALSRKKSAAALEGKTYDFFVALLDSDPLAFWRDAFTAALTDVERSRLEFYEHTEGPGKVFMLNQNPIPPACRGVSSTQTILHTIISHAGIQFYSSPSHCWLTPREMLTANGIPHNFKLGRGARCSSFCFGGTPRQKDRKRANVQFQAGNTMNGMVVGAFWCYVFGWTGVVPNRAD